MPKNRTFVCLVDPSKNPDEVATEIADLVEEEFQNEDDENLRVNYDERVRKLLMSMDATIEHKTGYNEPAIVEQFGFFINEESLRTIVEMARDYETIIFTIQSLDMANRLKNSIQDNRIGIVHPLGWIRSEEEDQDVDFYLQEVEWWDQLPSSITTLICNSYDSLRDDDFDSCILYSVEAVERAVIHTHDYVGGNNEEEAVAEKLSYLDSSILRENISNDIRYLLQEESRIRNERTEPEIGEAQLVFYMMLKIIQNMHEYLVTPEN